MQFSLATAPSSKPVNIPVDIVVNYYNPEQEKSLRYQTLNCIISYLSNNCCNVILSDGSGKVDNAMVALAKEIGFIYIYSNEKISFGRGYNQGIEYSNSFSSSEFICLSANDILVKPNSIGIMLNLIKSSPDIGCVIPYISHSDYIIQTKRLWKRQRYVNNMTLNVNLFRKKHLQDIGNVPENWSGCYNDSVMVLKLLSINRKILLCDAGDINHLAGATLSVSTSVSYIEDRKLFNENYSEYLPKNPHLELKYSFFYKDSLPRPLCFVLDGLTSLSLTKILINIGLLIIHVEDFWYELSNFVCYTLSSELLLPITQFLTSAKSSFIQNISSLRTSLRSNVVCYILYRKLLLPLMPFARSTKSFLSQTISFFRAGLR